MSPQRFALSALCTPTMSYNRRKKPNFPTNLTESLSPHFIPALSLTNSLGRIPDKNIVATFVLLVCSFSPYPKLAGFSGVACISDLGASICGFLGGKIHTVYSQIWGIIDLPPSVWTSFMKVPFAVARDPFDVRPCLSLKTAHNANWTYFGCRCSVWQKPLVACMCCGATARHGR